jgi:hypothetical protein
MPPIERWEYYSCVLQADAHDAETYLKVTYPDWDPPKYAPQALVPDLNRLGSEGWELVHLQPEVIGKNLDVLKFGSEQDGRMWTNAYFCVFKRRVA